MDPDPETEKMAALKRAYADVILNTAKESAARILAAERRAVRTQQALAAAKEEALAMLLRLKSLMDSKVKQAEMTSLSQVKRIQELEGQLQEAENTIGSFKEELENLNKELKKMKNGLAHEQKAGHATSDNGRGEESQLILASNLHPLAVPRCSPTSNNADTTLIQEKDVICFSGNVAQAESLKHIPVEKECAGNPDLASIIMRTKEPELYRNGCTQRIRAFEHNAVTAKASNVRIQNALNGSNATDSRKADGLCTVDSVKGAKIVTQQTKINASESEELLQPSSSNGNLHAAEFFGRISHRRPRTRCVFMKPSDAAISHNQNKRCRQLPESVGSENKSGAANSIKEGASQKSMEAHSSPISSISCKGAEDKNLTLNRISSDKHLGLFSCSERKYTEQLVMNQNNLNSLSDVSKSILHKTENNEQENSIGNPGMSCSGQINDGDVPIGTQQMNESTCLQTDDSKLAPADQNIEGNLDAKEDLSTTHLNSKVETSCESHSPQVGKDKFLKYTFQRTRKRGSSDSHNQSISPERTTTKRLCGDKLNVLPEAQKPDLATELPRDNRRLMQVARQLISLSEKRW